MIVVPTHQSVGTETPYSVEKIGLQTISKLSPQEYIYMLIMFVERVLMVKITSATTTNKVGHVPE